MRKLQNHLVLMILYEFCLQAHVK